MEKSAAPYSPILVRGNTAYVSGQLPVLPDGSIPEGMAAQTRACLINMANQLTLEGFCMEDVVKTTVFITDLDHFAEMNEEYVRHFKDQAPARSACEVKRLVRGALVEIECVAIKNS